jgi:cell division cycle 20-like protein 1 (cofactor of APC complex)
LKSFNYLDEDSVSLTPTSSNHHPLLTCESSSKLRKVNKIPCKVLDAPALQDDFYLNLIDWSANNELAVGLGNCIYLWNACNSKVTKLC